jgi:hypothetical protein
MEESIILAGKKCILAEGREEFAQHIADFSNNYNIWRFTSDNFAHPYLKENALAYIDSSKNARRGISFVIYTPKEGFELNYKALDYSKLEAVGGIAFKQNVDSANVKHTNEIGYK